jgi:hypothetical protein
VKDVFCEEAQRVKDDRLRPIEERFNSLSTVKDEDVFKPWQDAKKRTKEMLWSREQNMHVVGKTHTVAQKTVPMFGCFGKMSLDQIR